MSDRCDIYQMHQIEKRKKYTARTQSARASLKFLQMFAFSYGELLHNANMHAHVYGEKADGYG